jgi:hypothetical protein
MIEKGLILTGNDADLLDRALSEVKITDGCGHHCFLACDCVCPYILH